MTTSQDSLGKLDMVERGKMDLLNEGRSPSEAEVEQMNRFDLADGRRTIRFTGEHLATVDADDGERIRWIELSLYKTQAGKYVVQQVGKTVVYHKLHSACKPKQFEVIKMFDLDNEAAPCPVCEPPDVVDVSDQDDTLVRMESDLERVLIHPDVPTLIAALENTRQTGRRYHSRVARDLLVKASEKDQGIREAFLVTEVA